MDRDIRLKRPLTAFVQGYERKKTETKRVPVPASQRKAQAVSVRISPPKSPERNKFRAQWPAQTTTALTSNPLFTSTGPDFTVPINITGKVRHSQKTVPFMDMNISVEMIKEKINTVEEILISQHPEKIAALKKQSNIYRDSLDELVTIVEELNDLLKRANRYIEYLTKYEADDEIIEITKNSYKNLQASISDSQDHIKGLESLIYKTNNPVEIDKYMKRHKEFLQSQNTTCKAENDILDDKPKTTVQEIRRHHDPLENPDDASPSRALLMFPMDSYSPSKDTADYNKPKTTAQEIRRHHDPIEVPDDSSPSSAGYLLMFPMERYSPPKALPSETADYNMLDEASGPIRTRNGRSQRYSPTRSGPKSPKKSPPKQLTQPTASISTTMDLDLFSLSAPFTTMEPAPIVARAVAVSERKQNAKIDLSLDAVDQQQFDESSNTQKIISGITNLRSQLNMIIDSHLKENPQSRTRVEQEKVILHARISDFEAILQKCNLLHFAAKKLLNFLKKNKAERSVTIKVESIINSISDHVRDFMNAMLRIQSFQTPDIGTEILALHKDLHSLISLSEEIHDILSDVPATTCMEIQKRKKEKQRLQSDAVTRQTIQSALDAQESMFEMESDCET